MLDLAHRGAQLLHKVRHKPHMAASATPINIKDDKVLCTPTRKSFPKTGWKPDVAHRDGMAIVLYLLGPALWHGAAGALVELLPSEELLNVRLCVMLVLVIPGLHEVQVVDGLKRKRIKLTCPSWNVSGHRAN